MEKKSGAFRRKKVYFTQVSNTALRDNTLSLKAKGLYALIQSYITIEDFTLYKNYLKQQCCEGEKAFENTWKELKEKGYLIQYRLQDTENKQFYYEYELLDEKNVEFATEIHSKQNRKKYKEKSHTPQKEGMDKNTKAIPTKREGMGIRYNGQGGEYNNTYLNNTYLNNTYSLEEEELIKKIIKEITENTDIKIGPKRKKAIENLVTNYNWELINKALEIAINNSNTNIISYINTLLTDWNSKGLYNIDDVNSMIENRKNNLKTKRKKIEIKLNNVDKSNSKLRFNDYEQREYDYDSLERKLLGWD